MFSVIVNVFPEQMLLTGMHMFSREWMEISSRRGRGGGERGSCQFGMIAAISICSSPIQLKERYTLLVIEYPCS